MSDKLRVVNHICIPTSKINSIPFKLRLLNRLSFLWYILIGLVTTFGVTVQFQVTEVPPYPEIKYRFLISCI